MSTPEEKPIVLTLGPVESQDTLAVPPKAATPRVTNLSTTPTNRSARSSYEFTTPRTDKDNPFDTDIEALPSNGESPLAPRKTETHLDDCTVWPTTADWKAKAKDAKLKNRIRFNCLAGLSKRNRIIAKILIVFLIVGIAVGVGVGVSKHLGAPIWGDD